MLWIRLDDVPVMGRLVVMQRNRGTSSTYDCGGTCPCPPNITAVTVSPSPADMLVGATCQMTATEDTQDCNGITYYSTVTSYSTWTSSSTAICTVNASGLATGMAYGSTTISAAYTGYTYYFSPTTGCKKTAAQRTGSAPARSRQTLYAAVKTDTNTTDKICGVARKERTYQGLDDYGWIPFNEYWLLNETVTSKNSSCGAIIIDGDNNTSVGFDDGIETGCNNVGCVFETDQYFCVARAKGEPLRKVPGKDCVGLSDTQCQSVSSHTGWHTKVTNTSVTVTDN